MIRTPIDHLDRQAVERHEPGQTGVSGLLEGKRRISSPKVLTTCTAATASSTV